jgi:transaldolase
MKFFLDTASIDKINYWKKFDLVQGVTTNPTLLSKEGSDSVKVIKEICKIVNGDISAQVTEKEPSNMIEQAKFLKSIDKKIVIKLPCTLNGVTAAKVLANKKYKINITLGFDPAQFAVFRDINITYFSFIIGRVEDFGDSNISNIPILKDMIKKVNPKVKFLAASIRNSSQLLQAANNGADVITVPPTTWEKVFKNKYTLDGEKSFLESWKTLPINARRSYENK